MMLGAMLTLCIVLIYDEFGNGLDEDELTVAEASMSPLDELEMLDITMGGEDAGEYFEVAPEGGCLANLGAHNVNKPETNFPHHHPNFNIDEDAFELGSALYAQYAINYLNK